MALTSASFRTIFPEFTDATRFPAARIDFVLAEAAQRFLPEVWGDLLDSGTAYYVAHNLALFAPAPIQAGTASNVSGALPGAARGIVSAKSIDKVSVSYDTTSGQSADAGDFNLTAYGQKFYALAMTVSVGARQY